MCIYISTHIWLYIAYLKWILCLLLCKTKETMSHLLLCTSDRALLLLPFYSTHTFSFSNVKQNLDFLNFHFGRNCQINIIPITCFNIESMGENILMEELLHWKCNRKTNIGLAELVSLLSMMKCIECALDFYTFNLKSYETW